jgi:acyl-CoA reductase-like NAD-dependent aldehyde dehydrogenase
VTDRIEVRKTWKLYLDGAFVRSESGRTLPVLDAGGALVAHVSRASRKDARDAVRAARAAFSGWSGRTAANRGQILYRVAEMLEGRAADLADLLARGIGRQKRARAEVDAAIDRWVWYAGWCDKLPHVLGGAVPVAGPFFTFSVPEPTGVIALASPLEPALLGLTSRLAPVLAGGNTAIVVADGYSLPALALAEVLATSDVPGGVANILSGSLDEVVPVLAAHRDVDGLDLGTFNGDVAREAEAAAADNVKRVTRAPQDADWFEQSTQNPYLISAFLEVKTVWHPAGF